MIDSFNQLIDHAAYQLDQISDIIYFAKCISTYHLLPHQTEFS